MEWQKWVLWVVGLLMDRWVEIAVGVVVIAVWRWFMGHKFKQQIKQQVAEAVAEFRKEHEAADPPKVELTGYGTLMSAMNTEGGNVIGFYMPEVRVEVVGEVHYPTPPKYDVDDMNNLLAQLNELQRRSPAFDLKGKPVGSIRIQPYSRKDGGEGGT